MSPAPLLSGLALSALLLPAVASGQRPEGPPPEAVEGGVHVRTAGALDGYTLISPLKTNDVVLLDLDGEVVHRWETDLPPGNSVYLYDDGTLLRCGRPNDNELFGAGGEGGRLRRLAPDGTVLWDWSLNDATGLLHHDVEPLPNGNILAIAWEQVSAEEAVAHGRDPRRVSVDKGFWPDRVIEIEPGGADGARVVWEWRAWDHLVQDFDETKADYGDVTAHPERIDVNGDHRGSPPMSEEERRRLEELEEEMRALGYVDDDDEDDDDRDRGRSPGDWMHTNGISYDTERDLVSLSVHAFNEVWVIDHSTTAEEARGSTGGAYGRGGDLLWRWGNPARYGAKAGADQRFYRQHEGSFVPTGYPGAGNVLVFDNGQGRPGRAEWSRVVEVAVPLGDGEVSAREAGAALAPAGPVWTHGDDGEDRFYSSFISGAQRLPNGNTLICVGAAGRLLEVTSAGELVWDYVNEHGEPEAPRGEDAPGGGRGRGVPSRALFRATRYAADHPGIVALLRAIEGE